MNYVSFSLYGACSRYHIGAIRNAEQISKFYSGFVPVFYIGPGVPDSCIHNLEKLGAKIVYGDPKIIPNPRMWRFLAFEIPQADIVLVRDVDSRFSDREVRAVEQWLKSGRLFHVMRDYSGHGDLIQAGMWGWKKELGTLGIQDGIINFLKDSSGGDEAGWDQKLLAEAIWPKIKHSVMQHDSFSRDRYPGSIPFLTGTHRQMAVLLGKLLARMNCRKSMLDRPERWGRVWKK